MAGGAFCCVIYIINHKQMKTTYNISTTNRKSAINARVRSVMTLVGIITAIICSVILVQESGSTDRAEASIPTFIETSDLINTEMLANAGTAIWSMR
jgi:hypothetical protein